MSQSEQVENESARRTMKACMVVVGFGVSAEGKPNDPRAVGLYQGAVAVLGMLLGGPLDRIPGLALAHVLDHALNVEGISAEEAIRQCRRAVEPL